MAVLVTLGRRVYRVLLITIISMVNSLCHDGGLALLCGRPFFFSLFYCCMFWGAYRDLLALVARVALVALVALVILVVLVVIIPASRW